MSVARNLVRGCGQRGDRCPGKALAQLAQVGVLRSKRRSPLRDAVGLVDREQRDRQPRERREHALGHQPLRRHVEQPGLSRCRPSPRRHVLGAAVAGVDAVRRDPHQPKGRDLVLHQRHQRRDDYRETFPDQRRNLEAKRLARARRHDGQHVAAREQRLDRRLLSRAERREPEDLREHPARGAHRGSVTGVGVGAGVVAFRHVKTGQRVLVGCVAAHRLIPYSPWSATRPAGR